MLGHVLGSGETGVNKTDLPQPLQKSLCDAGVGMLWERGQEKTRNRSLND